MRPDSLVPYMMASCRSPDDVMFRRVCQVAAPVGSGLAVEPQLCLSGVTLKDDGMPGQTTGQHGHRRHRATGGCPIVCTVVLTTEWATTGQHGLTSSLFSYFLCRWHANSPSVLGRCHMDKLTTALMFWFIVNNTGQTTGQHRKTSFAGKRQQKTSLVGERRLSPAKGCRKTTFHGERYVYQPSYNACVLQI